MSITPYDPHFLQAIADTLSSEDRRELGLVTAVTLEFPQRFALYEELIERSSGLKRALALTRLGDLLADLGSGSLAVGLYRQSQGILSAASIVDHSFDEFLDAFEAQVDDRAKESLSLSKQKSFFQTWKLTKEHKFPLMLPQIPPESDQLRGRWQALVSEGSDHVAAYLRKLAIETNHVESTFLITEESTQDIIRRGVAAANVTHLPESALQDPEKIKSILNNTLAAYDLIKAIVAGDDVLSPQAIRKIHHRLMRTCQFTNSPFTPAGRTRTETRKTVVMAGRYLIECCPYSEVDKELEYICRMAKQWIKNWRNPLATSSWIHLVFVRCHPFEDGNGRMARLLASIPLIKHGFPPLSVSLHQRSDYYNAISEAYNVNHKPFIGCFLQGMQEAIDSVI